MSTLKRKKLYEITSTTYNMSRAYCKVCDKEFYGTEHELKIQMEAHNESEIHKFKETQNVK